MLSVCVCTRIIKYMPTEFNVRSDFCTVSYGNVLLIEEAFAVLYFYLCIFFFCIFVLEIYLCGHLSCRTCGFE